MSSEQHRHTLIRTGMHFHIRQMVQSNGFPNRLWETVRIFTDRSHVHDRKVKTTLYKVRERGYDTEKGWYVGTHYTSTGICLYGKLFKESHEKDVERLVDDCRCETESKETHTLVNDPKHTVLSITDLT